MGIRVKVKYVHVLDATALINKTIKEKMATDEDGRIDLEDLLDLIKDGSQNALEDADLEGKYDLVRDLVVAGLKTDGNLVDLGKELIKIAKENQEGIFSLVKSVTGKVFGLFKKWF